MLSTYGLTHLALAVKDLVRTRIFYHQVFDMEVMYEEKDFIQLTTPGSHDILVFERSEAVTTNTGGIAHFGFRLRNAYNIGDMRTRILNAGGVITDEGEFAAGSPYIFFRDPDGYLVEVWYELLPNDNLPNKDMS
jgi:catechol 2,3-dioxygenase-like lactoylglutathione lyase family enzyme